MARIYDIVRGGRPPDRVDVHLGLTSCAAFGGDLLQGIPFWGSGEETGGEARDTDNRNTLRPCAFQFDPVNSDIPDGIGSRLDEGEDGIDTSLDIGSFDEQYSGACLGDVRGMILESYFNQITHRRFAQRGMAQLRTQPYVLRAQPGTLGKSEIFPALDLSSPGHQRRYGLREKIQDGSRTRHRAHISSIARYKPICEDGSAWYGAGLLIRCSLNSGVQIPFLAPFSIHPKLIVIHE